MADDDVSFLHPRVAPRVNSKPLQRPGADKIVRSTTMLGPDVHGDRSLHLGVETLERLLELARSSPVRQVVIPRCGVQIDLRERPDGHRYEVWRIVGGQPKPEPMSPGMARFVEETRTG